MAENEGLVRDLREGDDAAQTAAARAVDSLTSWDNFANKVAIAEAGGIPPLVELLRDGSADAKAAAALALRRLAYDNAANQASIAETGGIPQLVQLLRDGSAGAKEWAAYALYHLADSNDANAVAIAVAVGFDALVQLARDGRVTIGYRSLVPNAGVPAKRKAALVVAALLRDYVPEFKSARATSRPSSRPHLTHRRRHAP
ncbi:hypothetical protein JL722_14594 [Aureococcus anophagefferens]|nr:hypothetical protein JL722_14594 [Aureococcus anophagefferens]